MEGKSWNHYFLKADNSDLSAGNFCNKQGLLPICYFMISGFYSTRRKIITIISFNCCVEEISGVNFAVSSCTRNSPRNCAVCVCVCVCVSMKVSTVRYAWLVFALLEWDTLYYHSVTSTVIFFLVENSVTAKNLSPNWESLIPLMFYV